jgi:hypothetical protein
MSVSESIFIDFTRSPSFFDRWNVDFFIPSVRNDYEFVFADYCPNNISECLDGNVLDSEMVHTITTLSVNLKWESSDNVQTVSIDGDTVWNVGDTHYNLKGIFLRSKSTNCVIGYSIFPNSVDVTNKVIFDDGLLVWSFI